MNSTPGFLRWMGIILVSAVSLLAQGDEAEKTIQAARMTVEVSLEKATNRYQDALRAFRPYREKLINFSLFTSDGEIGLARRKIASLKASEVALRDLVVGAEGAFQAELVRRKVPSDAIDRALENFRQEQEAELAFSEKMRATDADYITAMDGLADLAAAEFGHWVRRPIPKDPKQVTLPIGFTFKSEASDRRYRMLLATVARTIIEQDVETARVIAPRPAPAPATTSEAPFAPATAADISNHKMRPGEKIDIRNLKLRPGEKVETNEVNLGDGVTVKMTIIDGPIQKK